MKRLMLGNEAVAWGAYVANVAVATGYPGTPSTEIMEYFARYPGVYAEWSPNEKVALEVAMGASLAGARAMVTMKHVGLNVAADPFFAAVYMGVRGGLVIACADDPGMYSSQGEQDSRNYCKFAKAPLLEPSDSQECLDMMRIGLEISESYDTPVLLRLTGRVSHAQSLVQVDADQVKGRSAVAPRAFDRLPHKFVMLPVNARQRRVAVEERLARLREYAETTPLNRILWGDRRLGIVASSMAYQYVREVFPDASILKLGMAHPLPRKLIVDFANQVETLLIAEELDPFLEEQIRALPDLPPVRVLGKEVFPTMGEFSLELVARCAVEHGLLDGGAVPFPMASAAPDPEGLGIELPAREPVLCPGCGHRSAFYVLGNLSFPDQAGAATETQRAESPYHRANLERRRQHRVVVAGDIGCYTLGALQPLVAMDTCSCMGASIGHALGLEKGGIANKVVAVIGDSTFFHSGITGLVDVITSGSATTVVILDNFTTAMTGGNVNPGTGSTIDGRPAPRVELETLCRGLGVKDVQVLDALDPVSIERELLRTLQTPEPSVLILRKECVLQGRSKSSMVSWVDPDKCTGCWACLVSACPAIVRREGVADILPKMCTGCEVCNRICPHDAILLVEQTVV